MEYKFSLEGEQNQERLTIIMNYRTSCVEFLGSVTALHIFILKFNKWLYSSQREKKKWLYKLPKPHHISSRYDVFA